MIFLSRIFLFIATISSFSLTAMRYDYNLPKAIENDDIRAFQRLLTDDKKHFVDRSNSYAGMIIQCGKKNALKMIKLCYSARGIDNSPHSRSAILLHDCAQYNSLEVARWLLEQGMPVNALDCRENTALSYAKSAAFVDLICKYDGDVNHYLGAPLQNALRNKEKFEVIKALIKHGASGNMRNAFNQTPLFNACDKATVTLLINHGSDIFAENEYDGTALHCYVKNNRYDAAQTLLEAGARVNATDNDGNTPLHRLAYAAPMDKACLPCVRLLRTYGVNVNATNKDLEIASDIVKNRITMGLSSLLNLATRKVVAQEFKKIMKENILLKQILHGDMRRITTELDMGSNVNVTDANKRTPLMYAILKGDPALVKLLLNHGADITRIDNKNNQALNLALERKNLSAEHKKIYELIKQKEASDLETSYFKAYRHFNNHAKNARNNISMPNNKTLIRRNSL